MRGFRQGAAGFEPLAVRDFRLLFTGMVISQSLMPLQFVTQIFWVQEHVPADSRILLVGLIGTIRGVGALTFGLYGGALADRFDRRKLLIATQAASIAINLGVAAVMLWGDGGPASLALFFGLTLLAAGTFSVDAPTRQAMVPDLLGPRLTPAGISLVTAGAQIAMPVSIFASGFLVDSLGFAPTYSLSGAGLFCEVITLTAMHYRTEHGGRSTARYGFAETARSIREGVAYTRGQQTLKWSIALMVAMMALGFPAVANLGPTWVTTVVGVSFRDFGFVALTWGIGAFIASLLMTRFSSFRRRGLLLCLGAIGFGASFLVFAVPTVATAVVGNLGLGISLASAQISSMTLVQHIAPNEVRGRVMSLLQLNMGLAQLMTLPLAAIAQATSLEALFPGLAFAVIGLVALIVLTQRHLWGATVVSHSPAPARPDAIEPEANRRLAPHGDPAAGGQ